MADGQRVTKVSFNIADNLREAAATEGSSQLEELRKTAGFNRLFQSANLYQQFKAQASQEDIEDEDYEQLAVLAKQKGLLEALENEKLLEKISNTDLASQLKDRYDLVGKIPADVIDSLPISAEEKARLKGEYPLGKLNELTQHLEANNIVGKEQIDELKRATDATTLEDVKKEIKARGLADEEKLQKEINAEVGKHLLTEFASKDFDAAQPVHQQAAEIIKASPNQKENVELLTGFYQQAYHGNTGTIDYNPKNANLMSHQDGSVSLRVKDLNETGLSFALNVGQDSKGCQTLMLTNDKEEMSREQIQELARFFFKGNLVADGKEFVLPSQLKVKDGEGLSAQEIFNGSFKGEKEAQKQYEADFEKKNAEKGTTGEPQQVSNGGFTGGDAAHSSSGYGDQFKDFDDYLKASPIEPSYAAMKYSMEGRAGIMGFNKNFVRWRHNLDGSHTLVCYLNEADDRGDSELDKKGVQSRKKAFAVKIKVGPPAQAWLYMEPGKEIKAGHAKMILGAFKRQGCKYFIPSSTDDMSGAGNKAFWEAAGDQLMCPKLKWSDNDNGFDLGNDHLQVILKAIKDKNDGDIADVLMFKMRLVKELKGQTAYLAGKGKPNTALATATYDLEGDVKFSKFKSSHQVELEAYMTEQCEPGKKDRWTTADLASATLALKAVIKAVETGKDKDENPIHYDYFGRGNNSVLLKELLVKEMAANRPEIDKLLDDSYQVFKREPRQTDDEDDDRTQGSALKRAGEEVLKNMKEGLTTYTSSLENNYGESAKMRITIPPAAILKEDFLTRTPSQQAPDTREGGDKTDYRAVYSNSAAVAARKKRAAEEEERRRRGGGGGRP